VTFLKAAFLSLALAGTPTIASAEQPASSPAPAPKEKKICRASIATGSVMTKRTCHTRAEWDLIDGRNAEAASSALDHERQNGLQGTN